MKIFQTINSLAERTADKISGLIVGESYEGVVTLQFCINLVKKEQSNNPKMRYFTISVDENEFPKNENDNLIVKLSMEDINRNVLMRDYVFHAGKIDDDMTELLNGRKSVTIKMEE